MKKLFFFIVTLFFIGQTGFILAQATISDASNEDPEKFVRNLYDLLTFDKGENPDWEKVRAKFLPEAVVALRTSRTGHSVFSVDGFINDFKKFIKDQKVTETGFTEAVVNVQLTEFQDIAQCFVVYEASFPGKNNPPQRGLDCFSLLHTEDGWRIASIVHEIPIGGKKLPDSFLE